MNNNQLWQAVLGELELSISKANFTTWFKGTFILDRIDSKVVIGVPNTFTKSWLEQKFKKQIFEILDTITQHAVRTIEFKVAQKKEKHEQQMAQQQAEQTHGYSPAPAAAPTQQQPVIENKNTHVVYQSPEQAQQSNQFKPNTGPQSLESVMRPMSPGNGYQNTSIKAFTLNKKYSFSNFIVGKCNELAHAAAKAVAREPGRSYNPLFIYGGVGLGKTHLLQAVGNRVKQENPNARILYVSCEKFTSDFIKAITNRKIDQFKQTYRTVDLLLIDDVQFLAGKESTQEEFFHTFNELHQNNRQLIVTSDRPPKAIPELESRLLSRFEWGMIADVSPVDYETRVAIIETKCIEKGLKLDKEMIDYIAKAIHNNVREMEGALNRIKAHIELQNIHVDLDTIKNILATFVTLPRTDSLTPQVIIKKVAKYYDITLEELMGKGRARRLVYPRQLAMYLMREELQSSYPSIGKEMGGRDHTTAMHACQKITKELEKDEKVRQDYQLIKQRLFQ